MAQSFKSDLLLNDKQEFLIILNSFFYILYLIGKNKP